MSKRVVKHLFQTCIFIGSGNLYSVASIVSRDRDIVWIIYVSFHEPITNGVWTATDLPVEMKKNTVKLLKINILSGTQV